VERPFRSAYFAAGKPKLALCAAILMVCVSVVAGMRAIRTDQQSLPPVLTQLDQDLNSLPGAACEGKADIGEILAGRAGCKLGDPTTLKPNAAPDFVLLGDEQARMWTRAFDGASRSLGIHGLALAHTTCAPLKGAIPVERAECAQITDAVLDYVAQSPIQQVILAGNWMNAASSAFADPSVGEQTIAWTDFSVALQGTIRHLQQAGKAVTVILDIPHLDHDDMPRDRTLLSVSQQGADTFGPSRAGHASYQEPILNSIEDVWPRVKPFGIVDPAVELCVTGECLVARKGRTWYVNKSQLTDGAAAELKSVFFPLLRSVSAPR
jgi:hypothetical protein